MDGASQRRRCHANAAWLVLACIAFNLTRAAGTLASPTLGKAVTATVRRVERQQRLVELLAASMLPVPSTLLTRDLGVGLRTVERDLARLREAGVPIETVRGVHGGGRLPRRVTVSTIDLSFEEIAALISSLTALGPTATASSATAMNALLRAISDPHE